MTTENKNQCDSWGCTLRQNFDKLLVFVLIQIFLVYGIHVMHSKDADDSTLSWIRECVGTSIGGLLGLIQGQRQGLHNNSLTIDNSGTTDAVTTVGVGKTKEKTESEDK